MIQVPDLAKSFDNRPVVRSLSFTAPDGAITGLLGANGAGKTTTLRMICGVLQPESGSVTVVDLSVRRCRSQLAATVFGAGLFVGELAFCPGWIYRQKASRAPLLSWLFGSVSNCLVWLIAVAFFVFLVWYLRKKRAELAWLVSPDKP